MYPTVTNPTEDYLAAKGIALEDSDDLLIDVIDEGGNKHARWVDDSQPTGKTFKSINDKLDNHSTEHEPNGTDPLTTASAVSIGANSTNTEGTANSFARSDHTHDIATGNVSTQNAGQSNTEGTSANLARADHIHNIPTAAASTIGTNTTNTQGTNASFARSDHTHQVRTFEKSGNVAGAIAGTERVARSTASNFVFQLSTQGRDNFNGTDQLRVYVRTSTGTLSVNQRSIFMFRLGGSI